MNTSNLRKLTCIIAIVLTPSIAFAGGTNSQAQDRASTGQINDPDPGMKEGDMGLKGVDQSANPETSVVMDDSTLASNVKKAIKADAMLQNFDVKAEVSKGVVTLTGAASDVRQKARAETVASSVKGVKLVNNKITIGDK